MRHVLLHHHIFKNAGSTLDFALERSLGSEFSTIHDETETGVVDEKKLLDFLGRHPELKAVSSHHFHAQDYGASFRECRYRILNLALVRRPLQRLLSIYKQYRKSDGDTTLNAAAKGPVVEFIDLLIDRYPHFVDNVQVNIFANHGFYCRAVSERDLVRAQDWYLSFALCAPMERYDEAMVVFEYTLAPLLAPQQPDLAYVVQNVGEPLPAEDDLRSMVGAANFDWLTRINCHDEALWQAANRELDRRIGTVPGFEKRLRDLHRRCENLEDAGP